jgi:protein farnesyltransferase/geranylgeranyltransferase type-1 subunit alpha
LAPQNASPWNYLKGVLKRGGRGLECMQKFCEEFVGDDLLGNGVRSSHAVDWLAEIYQKQGEQRRAEECLDALSKKWDPIRANYWEYRKKQVVPVA